MKRILVTGATGFVGRFLCPRLFSEGWSVRGAVRTPEKRLELAAGTEPTIVETIHAMTPWEQAVADVDTVIHLAARVHIMADPSSDPLSAFRETNTEGTKRLAQEAVRAGVKRLVFVSSIKVNGEETSDPYDESSPVHPTDPYGISKWEAEEALRRIEAETGLEVVIVRPTLVYGPGVKANFLQMMRYVQKGIPLPLASINNRRSLTYVGNLVDALAVCAGHPAAAGQTFMMSDGEDVSTPELIRKLAQALGKPARLLPVPATLLRGLGAAMGKGPEVNRLLGSLAVDSSKIRRELGWTSPFTLEEGLRTTAEWYAAS